MESISAASDDLLWGGYRVARFTVFPSLNEGFGLPLAESLACGTPAVTSNYGSMREIVELGGGALLVDPRDDHSVADGMRALLTDDSLLEELRDPSNYEAFQNDLKDANVFIGSLIFIEELAEKVSPT